MYGSKESHPVANEVSPQEQFVSNTAAQLANDFSEIDAADMIAGIRREFSKRLESQIKNLQEEGSQINDRILRRHEAIKRTLSDL